MKRYNKLIIFIILILSACGGSGIEALIRLNEKELQITTYLELPPESPINLIDGGEIPLSLENSTDEERAEAAKGLYVDTTTPWTIIDSLNGECIYLNNPYGSQCVNTTNIITQSLVGYYMSTCGTGAARGIWDCRDYNARGGFELIYNPEDLRPGDLLVTYGGEFGHTGMVAGYYDNNTILLFSTNQGGRKCEKGGSAANTIKLNLNTFSGAFRWHGWDYLFVEPEPEPDPEPAIPISTCSDWNVEKGHTMSYIMLSCEGGVVYGEAMNSYAKTWWSQIYNKGKTVYDGWQSESGVGLFAGDYLLHER